MAAAPPEGPEAAVHGYLHPDGMESLARAAPLDEGSVLELPLLLLRGVVLFPGESLPLRLHSLDHIRLVLTLANQQRRLGTAGHLGVLNTRRPSSLAPQQHPDIMSLCESVGTTAELLEVETAEHWSVEEGMAAKARGRHRFRIIPLGAPGHTITTRHGVLWARVQILAENTVSPVTQAYPLPRSLRASWALQQSSSSSAFAYWPASVWRRFDPSLLVRRAQAVLRSLAAWEGMKGATGLGLVELAAHDEESTPEEHQHAAMDAVTFSFRLAANLPLTDELRQQLLAAETVVDRLRLLLVLLKESATRRLCCVRCRRPLATKTAVFTLPGAEGTVGAYVNAHGFVHQTLTLRALFGEGEGEPGRVYLEGEPESKDSWFTGYAWQIAYCCGCGLHLGWRFTQQQQQQQQQHDAQAAAEEAHAEGEEPWAAPQDRPPYFWGLRRAALADERPGQAQEEEEEGNLVDWMLAMANEMEEDEDDVEEDEEEEGSDTESESSEEEDTAS